jgi:hypothetical protein
MKRATRTHVLGRLLSSELDSLHVAIGHLESRRVRDTAYASIQDAEFRVFSQFGEDGIIQYLASRVAGSERSFVELGVDDYRESNSRFLLENDSWEGLAVDAGTSHLEFLSSPHYRFRHRIWGRSEFLNVENVNRVISEAGFSGEIGLLSIDLDGNDYWMLESIDVVTPRILVLEYNSVFGPDHAVTVPYDPGFTATSAHWSGVYFGASLAALCALAEAKGFQFVGSNSVGVNAFFVRSDLAADLPSPGPSDGWVASRHRLACDPPVRRSCIETHRARLRLIADLPVQDVARGRTVSVGELYDLG